MKIIFFDTETTGNTEKDFLCQLAYKIAAYARGSNEPKDSEIFVNLYKPPIPIPPETSAIHHITNKMVAEKPTFRESADWPRIKKLFENPETILVAHNAPFYLTMLAKEEIKPKNFICTLRLARHLDSEGEIGKYNLQYLRYLLELEIEAPAHDARGDVLVLEKLYERLKKDLMQKEKLDEEKVILKMLEVSSHPSIFKYINFGKYNGKQLAEIVRLDRDYLEWLLAQKLESEQIDEDWIYTLKHYLHVLP